MYRRRFAPKYLAILFGLATVLVLLVALRTTGFASLSPLKEAYSAPNPALPSISHIAPSAIMTNGWTNLFPNLLAVSAISNTEAWASGEDGHLIHYVDGSWTAVDPPSLQGVDLVDISMASANAGWIAAVDKAYQFDGTSWNERSTGLGNGLYLKRVSALGLNDAWGIAPGQPCYTPDSQIMHWDGSQWNAMLPPNTPYGLMDIKMTGPSDGWAVGYSCTTHGPIVLHYDGSNWTEVPVPPDPTQPIFYGLSVTGPNDIWTVGTPDYNTQRAVYHYSNGVWTSWLLPYPTIPWGIYMADDNDGWVVTDQGIWHWDGQNWSLEYSGRYFLGASGAAGRVWAVGLTDLVMSRPDIGPWTQQWGGPTSEQLNHVSALNADEAWAVGNAGTIVHYDGGAWQAITSTIGADLYGVQMLSSADGYAVGGSSNSNGVIAHWDGANWQQVMTTATTLRGIYMLNSGEGWAVGDGGAIWHGIGGAWTQVASPTTFSLHAVAMDAVRHGWAVGGYGSGEDTYPVLLEYDGSEWVDRSRSLQFGVPFLNDLTLAPGGAEGWAVAGPPQFYGPQGAILRLSSGIWTLAAQHPGRYGVALDIGGTAWAVGASPGSATVADYYTGSAWQPVQLPIGYTYPFGHATLLAVAMVPGQVGWAVGEYGSILRYTPVGSPSPTPTSTFGPSPTLTPTLTPVSTYSPSVTSVSTSAPTSTAPTSTSSTTPTASATDTPTGTPTATMSATVTAESTMPPSPTSTPPSATPALARTVAASPVVSSTPVLPPPTSTSTSTFTSTPAAATATPLVIATPTACTIGFTDVPPGSTFYPYIHCLACLGLINGYPDGTFKPNNDVTRGQLSKIVANAAGFNDTPTGQQFQDVPIGSTFYAYIFRLVSRGYISGYPCGGPGEPCVPPASLPYFRPNANATRGQISKIVSNAAGFADTPSGQQFQDVPVGSTYYTYTYRLVSRGVMSGYPCGAPPAGPCVPPANLPYFRPNNNATRGQTSKIVANTFFSDCNIPAR